MRIVDTRGKVCPEPLIAAKKMLKEVHEGEIFQILTDNKTSYSNLLRFLNDIKTEVSSEETGNEWRITVKKKTKSESNARPEDYCSPAITHFEKGDFIVVLSSDRMGDGDDDLGRLLMGNFLKALKDIDKLPQKVIFYNKGVTLATKDSPHIDILRDLEKMGVEIILCSTCVSHYGLGHKTGAGILSNMFTITEIMSTASRIIKP